MLNVTIGDLYFLSILVWHIGWFGTFVDACRVAVYCV